MPIDFDSDIRPFFQVMVKQVNETVTAQAFYKELKRKLAERSGSGARHQFKIVQPTSVEDLKDDHFFVLHVRHKQVPTWFKRNDGVDFEASHEKVLYDVENDLVVFYRKEHYIFVHTNCSQLFALLGDTQDELSEGTAKFKKLTGQQLNHILSQFFIEYRSLGIQNHFGLGGPAPDGKAYYGRDTSNSLTPSFDAGYGFSFCVGRLKHEDGRRQPFGCSKGKSKLWTSWIEDLDAFCQQCDQVVTWLNSPHKNNAQLDVLIQSTSPAIIKELTPVEFFLDYIAMEKGLVFLGDDEGFTLDWTCKLDTGHGNILFEIMRDDVLTQTMVELAFDPSDGVYRFSYTAGQAMFLIAIVEREDLLRDRSGKDLVTFLNKQHQFTILYDQPYAYRDAECWLDNRLSRVFRKAIFGISWDGVDIKKESLKASPNKNILERIDEHFRKDPELLFGCIDNGAHEIADYLAIYETKVILIHAKYASDVKPGLIIGDIQVVASQAVKNARFFLRSAYTETIIERLWKNATFRGAFTTKDDFKSAFSNILSSKDTDRECWIVQPGISAMELAADKINKMHTILNFVESVLRVNGIDFHLYCSK